MICAAVFMPVARLLLETTLRSMAHAGARSQVGRCLWSVLLPDTMWKSMTHVLTDNK